MTIVEEIQKLKQEKNAVILAHYYVRPEVQDIADYIGDSFYLSRVATELSESTIVFCGVSFMGESAKILNPDKTVLMPDPTADCPMAHMADVESIKKVREEYEDVAVVCYINSTAALKEYSDVCVTSANAVKIVKALPNKNIYFIPDRNLAHLNDEGRAAHDIGIEHQVDAVSRLILAAQIDAGHGGQIGHAAGSGGLHALGSHLDRRSVFPGYAERDHEPDNGTGGRNLQNERTLAPN